MIALQNIEYSYQEKPVLQHFSVQIETNKLSCILGSSGCGKTTLLRLIAGLETPEKGLISIDGKAVSKSRELLVSPQKRSIGFVFQDLALWPHFTVFDSIAFGLKERKAFSSDEIQKKVTNILHYFELSSYQNNYPHQLSGGQKQLLAIARALVLEPKILLMDEPLSHLDVKLKKKILAYIKRIHQEFQLTTVYVTHDHSEAFSIADTILIMHQGKIEAQGTVDEIKTDKNLYVNYFLEY